MTRKRNHHYRFEYLGRNLRKQWGVLRNLRKRWGYLRNLRKQWCGVRALAYGTSGNGGRSFYGFANE